MLGVSNIDRRDTTSVEVLKVSSKSSPNAVAGAWRVSSGRGAMPRFKV